MDSGEPGLIEPGGSTGILVAPLRGEETLSNESQIISFDQSSAAVPISPTTKYIPTKEEEALNFGRRVVKGGTYASRSVDLWMNGVNPKPEFVLWRYNCQLNDQKNLKENYRNFTASEENAHSEICNNYSGSHLSAVHLEHDLTVIKS